MLEGKREEARGEEDNDKLPSVRSVKTSFLSSLSQSFQESAGGRACAQKKAQGFIY